MNPIEQLGKAGQSVWCDNLGRKMIHSGELQRLMDLGIVGITSNPTIFMKSIAGGQEYDDQLHELLDAGISATEELYERLVLADIADAADLLRPVYDRTEGVDGYVSLEVNPQLAYDTEATIAEARRLFEALGRPNIFIKVPATPEGVPAIAALIGEGINVNVTLIFAVSVYRKVMDAYLAGLRKLQQEGRDLSRTASVASFFVSRVDSAVDRILEQKKSAQPLAAALLGKAAIANAELAYDRFTEVFDPHGPFAALKNAGARVQRPLWASTSIKNPAYPDTLYVDNLVAPHTVNTMPPQTIDATLDHGRIGLMLGATLEQSRRILGDLAEIGVDLNEVTNRLTTDGVQLFVDSYEQLLDALSKKRSTVKAAG